MRYFNGTLTASGSNAAADLMPGGLPGFTKSLAPGSIRGNISSNVALKELQGGDGDPPRPEGGDKEEKDAPALALAVTKAEEEELGLKPSHGFSFTPTLTLFKDTSGKVRYHTQSFCNHV